MPCTVPQLWFSDLSGDKASLRGEPCLAVWMDGPSPLPPESSIELLSNRQEAGGGRLAGPGVGLSSPPPAGRSLFRPQSRPVSQRSLSSPLRPGV